MISDEAVEAAARGIMGVTPEGWAWYSEPVREQARAQARRALESAAPHVRARHSWGLLGGGGGWEVWQCANCKRKAIPLIFGILWPFPRCQTANPYRSKS